MADQIAALQVVIEAQTAAFTKGIQDAQRQLQNLNKTAKDSSGGINSIADNFKGLQGVFFKFQNTVGAVNVAFGLLSKAAGSLGGFVHAADEARKLDGVLTEILGSSERAAHMMKQFFSVAENGDLSIKQAKDSILTLAKATKDLGLSNNQLTGLTTTFFQLGKIGGKSAEEMTGAWRQFTMAMQRGELSAGQLNRMLRTSPELVGALKQALGVSTQELERMAKQGQLTSSTIVKAFEKIGPEVADKFGKLPKTFADGMEQFERIMYNFQTNISKVIFNSEVVGETFEKINIVLKKVTNNFIDFTKDLMKYSDEVVLAVGLVAAAFSGPLLSAIIGATVALKTLAFSNPITAGLMVLVSIAVAVAANWNEIKLIVTNVAIAFLDFFIMYDKYNPFTKKEHLEGMIKYKQELLKTAAVLERKTNGLELVKGINDVGDAAGKSSPRLSKGAEAMQSWADALQKAQEEINLIPQKIKILEDMINSLSNTSDKTQLVFLEKLKGDLASLKAQMAAGNPLELLRLEMQKIGDTQGVSAAEKIEIITTRIRELGEAGKLTEHNTKALTAALDAAFKEEKVAKLGPELAALSDQIDQQARSFSMVEEKIKFVTQAIREMVDSGIPEDNQMLKYLRNMQEEMTKTKDSGVKDFLELRDAVAGFSQQFAGQFVDNLLQGKVAFDDFAKGLLNTIVKTMMNQMVQKFLTSFMGGGGTSFGSSFLGSLFGKNAVGNAFQSGTGLPYGVYDKPTFFQMGTPIQKFAKGGVLGEAGPEAIMPLKRGGDGKLGVSAAPTVINVINNAGVEVSTAENTGQDGQKTIDIMIEKKVKDMFGSGSMDKTMKVGYGLSRSAA